jgi:hypothetical protein
MTARPFILRALTVLLAALACDDATSEPPVDCRSSVGVHYIDLEPEPLGYGVSYEVITYDSIQLVASVRRVDESQPTFNPQQGWSCSTSASSPVAASVSFSTTTTDIVRLSSGGWIHGLRRGDAIVTASSTQPAATLDIYILVYGP